MKNNLFILIISVLFLLLSSKICTADYSADSAFTDCIVTINEIIEYNYGYRPVSEGSQIYNRVIEGAILKTKIIEYDQNGIKVSEQENTSPTTSMPEDIRLILPLIEKANRNIKTSGESLISGDSGFSTKK